MGGGISACSSFIIDCLIVVYKCKAIHMEESPFCWKRRSELTDKFNMLYLHILRKYKIISHMSNIWRFSFTYSITCILHTLVDMFSLCCKFAHYVCIQWRNRPLKNLLIMNVITPSLLTCVTPDITRTYYICWPRYKWH